tara:strand:- start:6 stop:860 length:855 start_codon:yes stop_codon:yes gene_type:complete
MKLITFTNGSSKEIGIVLDSSIVPLKQEHYDIPVDMISLIEKWDELLDNIKDIVSKKNKTIDLKKVKIHQPIINPKKILAHGLNYADHINEMKVEKPKNQIWFSKFVNTLNGPFDHVLLPSFSTKTDYEVELVVIIGKKGKSISVNDALKYVFGYCVGNDVSVRDWQMRTSQWTLGKSFDTHGPIGPFITTADEIPNPHCLSIQSYVNGELRQNSNTSQFIFKIPDLISYISQAITLEPGDLIFTGTPSGVGLGMKPPIFLKSGDVVKCQIDKLGSIENIFKDE